jgi:RNA polymerase sigma-70 factor, ECF subfamily
MHQVGGDEAAITAQPPLFRHNLPLEYNHGFMGDITELLQAASASEPLAQERLLDAVYAEMHRMAASFMRRERVGHTLQPTALVNEAYVRLLGGKEVSWDNRAHFYVAAARTMRRILIDHARTRSAAKRAGEWQRVDLDSGIASTGEDADLLGLNAALDRLAVLSLRQVQVVELRYFTGLDVDETARVLGVSDTTVKRDWALARAFIERELRG